MSMPLDLYVIRHGESEANVIVQAGEQGDNSLYTQDNVTVPDRSWRLTATGRKQADCIGRWLVSQQQLFDRYMVSPYVRTRETAATMALPKAKWEENRVLRERSWGEINTITKDELKTTTHATGTSRTPIRCTGVRRQASRLPMWPRTVCTTS